MRTIRASLRAVSLAVAVALAGATGTRAQSPNVMVRVRVTDSSGVPVPGADVSIVHTLTTVLARGTTDERGEQVLTIPRAGADNELVVRKIGFARYDRFFNDSSVTAFDVRLIRTIHALDTVRVAAQEDVRRKSYFIDADGIENAQRPIVDALDVLLKLRPDMVWGRRGPPDRIDQHVTTAGVAKSRANAATIRQATKYGYCPPLSNVWVNGVRVRYVAPNPTAEARLVGPATLIAGGIATVLASIKPEHIAEIEYHPCEEVIADAPPNSTNAVVVTLKPGIRFEPGLGSFLATPAGSVIASAPGAPTAPHSARLIGVFDEATGEVVAGAEVVDVTNGTFMRTSTTGTATLAFLSAGAKEIRIQKPGYEPLTIPVSTSPSDTAAVTVLLTPQKHPPIRLQRDRVNAAA